MSDDIHADALEQYERAAAELRANLGRVIHGWDAVPLQQAYFPLLGKIRAMKLAAEERDRREWIEGVRRRLGLVAKVHRPRIRKTSPWSWGWHCQRDGCTEAAVGCMCLKEAFGDALAHARAFVPEPPEEEPFTELQWALYAALRDEAARQREADEAALGARILAVTEQVNDALAGVLPDGMRLEWGPMADG